MAVAEMKKLRLVGLSRECDKVMDTLSKSGVFEVCPTSDMNVGKRGFDSSHLDRLIGKQVKAAFAIEYLQKLDVEATDIFKEREKAIKKHKEVEPFPYKPAVKSKGRRIITQADFYDGGAKEYELLTTADSLEKINFRRLEIKSELVRLSYKVSSLEPFESFPLKFSDMHDTRCTSRLFVYSESAAADLSRIENADFPAYIYDCKAPKGTLLSVIVLKEHREKALDLLSSSGFSKVEYTDDMTGKELIEETDKRMTELKKEDFAAFKEGLNYVKYLGELQILYDYLGLEIEKSQAESGFIRTENTFVVEGWLPSSYADEVLAEIRSKTENVCAFLTDPEKDDNPPTLLNNPKLIAPFEEITNLYSPPAYGELDPNPFMAVFFFIFYGFMMADAGYGAVMTVAALIILNVFKLEKGTSRLIALIGICGISTIFWGIMFGGLFGIDGVPALWFNPLQEPLMMFGLSLGLGVVQVVFGYGLYTYKAFKQKKYFAGIIDVIFKITIIIGVGLILLNILLGLSSAFTTAGIAVIIASLVGIVATAGHNSPTVGGKIAGGFAGIYDLVNLLSDILSYARLFGLALASAAIALAFNTLGALFFGIPVIGYVIGIIILIPLHVFNLGLGLLSGYVHNARLQFIEFYNKFYDGGGRLFSPMGEKTKYIRFAPKETAKKRMRKENA